MTQATSGIVNQAKGVLQRLSPVFNECVAHSNGLTGLDMRRIVKGLSPMTIQIVVRTGSNLGKVTFESWQLLLTDQRWPCVAFTI
jgi:hypothetical protein